MAKLPNNCYLIDGPYGSGKTTYAVSLILDYLKHTNHYIFTDIKMLNLTPEQSKRVFFYDATRLITFEKKVRINAQSTYNKTIVYYNIMDILEIMRMIREEWDKSGLDRNQRPAFTLFFDETGAIFNKYNIEDQSLEELYDYMVQIRKLNGRIFLISQEHSYLTLRIRSLANTVFYNKPIPFLGDDEIIQGGFPRFNQFSLIYRKKVDPETSLVLMEKRMERNEHGRLVPNEKPLIFYQDIIYKPKYWKYYDDLYMNMRRHVKYPISEYSNQNYELIKNHFFKPFTSKKLQDADPAHV